MSDSPPLSAARRLASDAFHLGVAGHRPWRGDREIPSRPKAWDVLHYLVERPGLLVTSRAARARPGPGWWAPPGSV